MPYPTSPQRGGLLGGIGRACYRHRWLTLIGWLAGLACLITLWMAYGAAADNSFSGSDPGQALLNAHFHQQSGDALTLAIQSADPIRSPAVAQQVNRALVPFKAAPGVSSVTSPYADPRQISRDGHIAFATIQFSVPSADISNSEALALMADARAASGHGVTLSLGGDVVDLAESPYGGPTDGIGVTAAAFVLLIAFGSLLAMGLPVLTALFGIGSGLSLIGLLGHIFPAPSFSPVVASLIGLGVGVDYALFIVTRFREALRGQLARHRGRPAGPGGAGTAGRGSDHDEHGGQVGAHRGHDSRHRSARAAGTAPATAVRRGGGCRRHRRDDGAGRADPAASPARLHRDPAGQAIPAAAAAATAIPAAAAAAAAIPAAAATPAAAAGRAQLGPFCP